MKRSTGSYVTAGTEGESVQALAAQPEAVVVSVRGKDRFVCMR